MGEPGPDVFLSYAREDETRAGELATALGQCGFSVFWDRKVPPAWTWRGYIGEALANARCVVVAWSRHSIASQWVLEEASEGRDRNVLIPVLFETVPPPFGFREIQAANLTDWRPGQPSDGFDGLLGAVQRIVAGQAGSGTGAEAEPTAPPRPVPSEPAAKTKPPVRLSSPPPAPSGRPEPVTPPNGQASGWSGQTAVAMVAGFVALVGAVGTAVLWWITQPGPIGSTPVPPAVGPSIAEPKRSKPGVETAPARAPTQPSPAPGETGEPPEEMRDCAECPKMVLVPAGEFTMGSSPGEPSRDNAEGPQHEVAIAEPFWVGKYEVTFAEWDACVAADACRHEPSDNGWGHDNRPVVSVSWKDAKEYVDWLSQKTGEVYRLLSEAEWEYVARAGSTTAFWWGQDIGRGNANCGGCGTGWGNKKTAPVGSFKANDFGLYDTAGNVGEWVEDCWNPSYDRAPTDGRPWEKGNCSLRVLRGGDWRLAPWKLRSASRLKYNPMNRIYYYGFRVARAPD